MKSKWSAESIRCSVAAVRSYWGGMCRLYSDALNDAHRWEFATTKLLVRQICTFYSNYTAWNTALVFQLCIFFFFFVILWSFLIESNCYISFRVRNLRSIILFRISINSVDWKLLTSDQYLMINNWRFSKHFPIYNDQTNKISVQLRSIFNLKDQNIRVNIQFFIHIQSLK